MTYTYNFIFYFRHASNCICASISAKKTFFAALYHYLLRGIYEIRIVKIFHLTSNSKVVSLLILDLVGQPVFGDSEEEDDVVLDVSIHTAVILIHSPTLRWISH